MKAKLRNPTLVGLVLLSLGVSACGLGDAIADRDRATRALKTQLGVDANVGVEISNGHATVSVRLPAPPAGDAAETKRLITDLITRSCRTKIERVDISY